MRLVPTRDMLKQSWEKYGLIVIGNIVFFVLLYFVSYRPHNEENRAAEMLSFAQEQETQGVDAAAKVLYEKVLQDYPETRAAATAGERLPVVSKRLAAPIRPEPELVEPRLDLGPMLSRGPSLYVAAFLAEHYDDDPTLKPKIHEAIQRHLWVAVNHEGIGLESLRREKEFQSPVIQREIFAMRPRCVMSPDWIYDDFSVKNDNFFPWHNVNLEVSVTQGEESAEASIRLPVLEPGESVDLLELRVRGDGGAVTCAGELTAQEGRVRWSQDI